MNMQINHAVANRLKLVKLKIEQCNAPKIPSSIYCSMLWYSMLMHGMLMYSYVMVYVESSALRTVSFVSFFLSSFFFGYCQLCTHSHTRLPSRLSLSLPHSISLRLCSSLYSRFSLSLSPSLCCIEFGFLAIVALSVA